MITITNAVSLPHITGGESKTKVQSTSSKARNQVTVCPHPAASPTTVSTTPMVFLQTLKIIHNTFTYSQKGTCSQRLVPDEPFEHLNQRLSATCFANRYTQSLLCSHPHQIGSSKNPSPGGLCFAGKLTH
jgi:hypothetical protein